VRLSWARSAFVQYDSTCIFGQSGVYDDATLPSEHQTNPLAGATTSSPVVQATIDGKAPITVGGKVPKELLGDISFDMEGVGGWSCHIRSCMCVGAIVHVQLESPLCFEISKLQL
jgi:hypothetical protein